MSISEIRHLPAIEGLVSDIIDKRDVYNRATATETDSVKIFRAQGALEAIDAIIEMIDADDLEEDEPDRLPR